MKVSSSKVFTLAQSRLADPSLRLWPHLREVCGRRALFRRLGGGPPAQLWLAAGLLRRHEAMQSARARGRGCNASGVPLKPSSDASGHLLVEGQGLHAVLVHSALLP